MSRGSHPETHRAIAIQSILGPETTHSFHSALFIVADLPPRAPVWATSAEPLQTVIKVRSLGTVSHTHCSNSGPVSNPPRPTG
jgi:hypothetical protein